eukprot:TRINITY_DN78446_c0_g1_i1.p1 TRINITY_DN78446_c0_g1~~TRINITY_DN78446_c0_g1_i1.p1  ORF type:complete len:245 (-),score=54.53 TRINITY_DN78446_c0_g1_i1:86-820(-)
MFHALKRSTVGHSAAKNEPVNAEFETLRTNLDNVQKSLQTAMGDIDDAQKAYTKAAADAGKFSTTMHSLYPKDDETRELFKTTVDQVADVVPKDLETITEPASNVRALERMVSAYLTEIKTLSAEYPKLETARKDYAMYQAKVEKLGKKDSDNDKQSRNMGKLEDAKAKYNSMLEGIIHRMKITYEKASLMFRASYVAYWIYQKAVLEVIGKHFGPAMSYAADNVDGILQEVTTAQTPPSPNKT